MAYSKTTWQNNVTDIDENNLNKIEQGIYDNSLVVDAITNTINPTDTETYKTAELTEGQITDVIGVNDILIKGQTSQDGEPTPDSPVNVNVVSGSNVINTSNKNLYIPTLENNKQTIYKHDGDVTLIKDEFEFLATGTDMYLGQVLAANNKYYDSCGKKIFRNGHTHLSILVTNTSLSSIFVGAFNKQELSLGYVRSNSNSMIYTFPENCDFVTVRVGKNPATVGTIYKTKVIVVYGDIIPTTYEPHQGKELPLDLGSIELCKIENYQDYFYKSGSKWYLHKEIGSFILNGNVSFQKYSSSNSYYTTISRFTNNVPVCPETNNIVAPIICTHFDTTYINDIAYNSVQKIGFSYISSKEVWFGLPTSIATNASEVQNWLNNQINNGNPVVVRYALATPTDTEIIDTTLISQLEAIYNAPLYEQTNITQTNNDLPMVLNITACKDNINGIKAFIRK